MTGVLNGIADSRSSSERTKSTVRLVRTATEEGSRSFGQIEAVVEDADGWMSATQRAAISTNDLSRELRSKLDSLATGTESFAAAMEQVAASSQEQSASTEQIAAAAGTLAGAAERLGKLVANLRITEEHAAVPPTQEPPATPRRPAPEVTLRSPLAAQ
jgi:methyl-accepting chemotaxis protein